MKITKNNKIRDWFVIQGIRITTFIKEHKYISTGIGAFLVTCIVILAVNAANDTTVSSASISTSSLTASTEASSTGTSGTEALNFTNVVYRLTYALHGADSNNDVCSTENQDITKLDNFVFTATAVATKSDGTTLDPSSIEWLGTDESASYSIDQSTNKITITVPAVNLCSEQYQTFTLRVLNADKSTAITLKNVTLTPGSNASSSLITTVTNTPSITTNYTAEYELEPKVREGVAKKEGTNRDARFGVLLGFNSSTEVTSLKGLHLSTDAVIRFLATQTDTSVTDYLSMYTNNTSGNYFGVYTADKRFFTSINVPDLSSTSGTVNHFKKSDYTDTTLNENSIQNVTVTSQKTVEYDVIPVSKNYVDDYLIKIDDGNETTCNGTNCQREIHVSGETTTVNSINLNTPGEYEIHYINIQGNKKVTLVKNVRVTATDNEYKLEGPKTMEVIKNGTLTSYGIYDSTSKVAASTYSIKYYNSSDTEVTESGMLSTAGTYTQKYIITTPAAEEGGTPTTTVVATRTIKVVNTLSEIKNATVETKDINIFQNETYEEPEITISGTDVKCSNYTSASCTVSYDKTVDTSKVGQYVATYTITDSNNNKEVLTQTINVVPRYYEMKISGLNTTGAVKNIGNGFYAIGSYFVTAQAPISNSTITLTSYFTKTDNTVSTSSASIANSEYSFGTNSASNDMYVSEPSGTVKVDADDKTGLNGNYYSAAMGEEITYESNFQYGYDADDNISKLTATIPVNGNLIPTSFSSDASEMSSYFYINSTLYGNTVEGAPTTTIKYCYSDGSCDSPDNYDGSAIVDSIKIEIESNNEYEIEPGTLITLKNKFKVRTISGSDETAPNVSNLSFTESTVFSWTMNDNNITTQTNSSKTVYITPYKLRNDITITNKDDVPTSENIILDASKNDVYTIFSKPNIVSPAMNINSNIFGYNKLTTLTVQITLPVGFNYVYNKTYDIEPVVSYINGNQAVLTYTYHNVEPNAWIEPIYADFNVDTTITNSVPQIVIKTSSVSDSDVSIRADVSSHDKFLTEIKQITISNAENLSYGEYTYSSAYNGTNTNSSALYISNINKDTEFAFATKLHNNISTSTPAITNISVYTVLPYNNYNGTYEITTMPSGAMCTDTDPSNVVSKDKISSVNWVSCNQFKNEDDSYSGLTAYKVDYSSIDPSADLITYIKIKPYNNKPGDTYTFKSFLTYKKDGVESNYINFRDQSLDVVSKKITGVVWEDFDVDGIMQDSEKKIDSVTLKLYNSETDELIKTTVPDSNGKYEFDSLDEGVYYIIAEFNTDKYGITSKPSEDYYDNTKMSVFYSDNTYDETGSSVTKYMGDVDDDGSVTEADAKMILRFAAGLSTPTTLQKQLSDLDNDGQITVSDAQIALNMAKGNINLIKVTINTDDDVNEVDFTSIIRTNIITIDSETRTIRYVNLGLSLRKKLELKITKYITKAEVTDALGIVTTKNYGNVKLAKLNVKDMSNIKIKVVYTLEIENVKYYPGYATLISDQVPSGMEFNSNYEENKGWAINEDGQLVNTSLSDTLIYEGEKKYLTIAFDITRKEAGSFVNYASIDDLDILGGVSNGQ